jgi:hypothetical protein
MCIYIYTLFFFNKKVIRFSHKFPFFFFKKKKRIAASVAGITICARTLVTSIEELGDRYELSTGFIGIVLLPLCGM